MRTPLAVDGDDFADCAAEAAGLGGHEAYDQQEAKKGNIRDRYSITTFEGCCVFSNPFSSEVM